MTLGGGPKGTPGVAKSSQERATNARGDPNRTLGGPKGTPGGQNGTPEGPNGRPEGSKWQPVVPERPQNVKQMKNYKMKAFKNEKLCLFICFNWKNERPMKTQ